MIENRITLGSLISIATERGFDAEIWRDGSMAPHSTEGPSVLLAPPSNDTLDLQLFDVGKAWNRIPRRDWIMSPILIAGHYSMLVATGASGKSSLAVTMALALVTGRSDMLGLKVDRPSRVVLVNGEDGQEELMRRVRATAQHFNITKAHLEGRLLVVGARQIPGLIFNRSVPGGIVADEGGLSLLEDVVRRFDADVIILDPLSSFLPGGMNDGASASSVAGRLTEICVAHRCAMLLVHHVSKSALRDGDGDATAALGSAMWTNHARAVFNIRRPTPSEAQNVGLPPSAARSTMLVSHSKSNLTPAEDAMFVEIVSVELPNAKPPNHPFGDNVGVARRLRTGSMMDLFTSTTVKAVLDQLAIGTATGLPYKPTGRAGAQDYKSDVGNVLHADFPQDTPAAREKLALQLVGQMLADGRLIKTSVTLPRMGGGKGGGKSAEALLVNWAATDWYATPGTGVYAVGTGAP